MDPMTASLFDSQPGVGSATRLQTLLDDQTRDRVAGLSENIIPPQS